ncbi:hypothetical protein EVAR_44660_1 [Eumeta japonica]|uniref:Uncharacterized protein n=1 Tax=Eumeta variegata TaxID=151549 RepID=A0A4C1XGX1_EUMVA|nr:hypothetical protein EVAR_44660_1 [Eumeta japonica]
MPLIEFTPRERSKSIFTLKPQRHWRVPTSVYIGVRQSHVTAGHIGNNKAIHRRLKAESSNRRIINDAIESFSSFDNTNRVLWTASEILDYHYNIEMKLCRVDDCIIFGFV